MVPSTPRLLHCMCAGEEEEEEEEEEDDLGSDDGEDC